MEVELVARHYKGREATPILAGIRVDGEAEYTASKGVTIVYW